MIHTLVKDEMYERAIVFVGDCTERECSLWLKAKYGIDHEFVGAIGKMSYFEDADKNTVYVVWVQESREVHIVAHEVLHLAIQVMRDVGMTLGEDSEEAYTWYFERLLKTILIFIAAKGKKHGRNIKHKRKRSSGSTTTR